MTADPLSDPQPALTTDRLVLEPLVATHAAELYPALQDVALYTFFSDEPPESVEDLTERYRWWSARRSPDGQEAWLNWAVRRREDGAYVGTTQATIYEDRTALIAYIVFTPYQRQGYAVEACRAMLDYLERDLAVTKIAAEIDTRNLASIGLVERLGFERVATTYDVEFFKGATSHEHRYERVRATARE